MFTATIKSRPNEDICLLFSVANHPWNYVCECGEASDLTVKECQNTNAIFISHTHIDHFCNFDKILRHQIGIQRRVTICGPKGIAEQVQAKIKGYTWNLIERNAISYEIREIIDLETISVWELEPPDWELKKIRMIKSNCIFENEAFQTNFTILDHKIPSIAYRFKTPDTMKMNIEKSGFKGGKWVRDLKLALEENKGEQIIEIEGKNYEAQSLFYLLEHNIGATLGVIMDHAANVGNHLKIIDLFRECDEVYIESFYKADDIDYALANFHSYSAGSGLIMREAKVKKAIPVHFSRRYDEADLELIRKEFTAALSEMN